MNYTRSVDVGSIDFFYYNPVEQSLLDPFSTTIPGIGPLSAVEVIRTNLYWGEFESINDHYADGITPNPDNPGRAYPMCNSLKGMIRRMTRQHAGGADSSRLFYDRFEFLGV